MSRNTVDLEQPRYLYEDPKSDNITLTLMITKRDGNSIVNVSILFTGIFIYIMMHSRISVYSVPPCESNKLILIVLNISIQFKYSLIHIYIYIICYICKGCAKSTAKAKLKATSQQDRIHLSKQHFENLLGNPPEVTHEPIARIISKQLDIKLGPFTQEELD